MSLGVVDRLWLEVDGRQVAVHVLELGLACCGVEVREARRAMEAAGAVRAVQDPAGGPPPELSVPVHVEPVQVVPVPVERVQVEPVPVEPVPVEPVLSVLVLSVLVVAGTVTTRLAPALRAALDEVPEPRAVLAFGACAATGGPYWDSYSVVPGAHEVVAVDAWVAGCPPRPQDLVAGLREVLRGRQ